MNLPLPNVTRVREEADNLFRNRPFDAAVLEQFAAWIACHRVMRENDDCDLNKGLSSGLSRALPHCAAFPTKLATFEQQAEIVGRGETLPKVEEQASFLNVLLGWSIYRDDLY